ncbi:polyketide synthase [Fusarium agapanthi]|uniref:Polyketide synthase n=1 Tax=Fusarium agapanthi TaxID=1803897 RepID=A0A9P5EBA9_9HYPO|nr:polyketide synthase [Fusarium agapanthi]
MADNTPGPSVLTKAKPTVRVKGKEHEYGETLEFYTLQSRGGNRKDLMLEERFLNFPEKDTGKVWTAGPRAASCSDHTGQAYEEDWD